MYVHCFVLKLGGRKSHKGLLETKGVRHFCRIEKGVTNMSILDKILLNSFPDEDGVDG